jgi:Stress responsive A/B Barrel Domain
MVHHLCLLRLKEGITSERIESMMVDTRIRLLKLPEVSNLHVGKRIEVQKNPFAVFYAFDVESMEKLEFVHESAIYVQFQRQVIEPFVIENKMMNYEMEPRKEVVYS